MNAAPWAELLNSVKRYRTTDWLSPSQEMAYGLVMSYLASSPRVCLCGPIGSGKSFLGSLVASVLHIPYFTRPTRIARTEGTERRRCVVDGCPDGRLELRSISSTCRVAGYSGALLICRKPEPDQYGRVCLGLNYQDVAHVYRMLVDHCGYAGDFQSGCYAEGLWGLTAGHKGDEDR